MKLTHRLRGRSFTLSVALLLVASTAWAADLRLSGDSEVPPVKTLASGNCTIAIAADRTVAGSVKTTGIPGVAAHIHVGSTGKSGPVIISLTKGSDGEWLVPPGTKLSSEQMHSFSQVSSM